MADRKDDKSFADDMAARQKAGIAERLKENSPPPGVGTDGKVNFVEENAPPWKPEIVDPDTFKEDYSDLED